MVFARTPQQQEIVDAAVAGLSLKVKAFAGCTKTTTLVMVSEELGHNCLYLAYNKKMQLEAVEKFPENVEVRTVHSMAYQVFGAKMAHKLARPKGPYRNVCGTASEIARAYKIFDIVCPNGKKVLAASIGKAVKDTVAAFENSASDHIGSQHVRFGKIKKFIQAGLIKQHGIEQKILENAKRLWEARVDMNDPTIATHETYLKLYQLSKPNLGGAFKTIFLDEAQDSNDCVLDIVLSQKAQVIIVGDDYQAIYQWRGSINALDKVTFTEKSLTTSFRFGSGVAEVANRILNQTVSADVRGNPAVTTVVHRFPQKVAYPYTKIFRTNAALLLEAVDLIASGVAIQIEVDFKDLIRAFESAEALFQGRTKDVKHDLFLGCETWEDAKFEADSNGEIARIVKLVENGQYLHITSVLSNYKPPENPQVIYITAHKSKGLEWDVVVIADDYPSAYKDGKWVLPEAERNLQYVANTRAKKVLHAGRILHEIDDFYAGGGGDAVEHSFDAEDEHDIIKEAEYEQRYTDYVQAQIKKLKTDALPWEE